MGIVEEECDEGLYWLEIFTRTGMVKEERLADLKAQVDEILATTVSSIKTARAHLKKSSHR